LTLNEKRDSWTNVLQLPANKHPPERMLLPKPSSNSMMALFGAMPLSQCQLKRVQKKNAAAWAFKREHYGLDQTCTKQDSCDGRGKTMQASSRVFQSKMQLYQRRMM
jgi:hypothetical protein